MEVNYMKLGDKVYSINEIQGEAVDIDAELKEFYEERHGQLATEFGQTLNEGMQSEWDTQIAHLRKFENRGAITVPQSMFNILMIVCNNALMPVRMITYSPNEITCTGRWLFERCTHLNFDDERWNGYTNDDDLIVKITPSFSIPLVCAFDKKGNKLYTPFFRTYHTMSGHSVCTGNHKASEFWSLDDRAFEVQMNRINTFSPARHNVEVDGNEYIIKDLITNETFISVERKGASVWRA